MPEAAQTSHLDFRTIRKIATIHARSGFIRGIPVKFGGVAMSKTLNWKFIDRCLEIPWSRLRRALLAVIPGALLFASIALAQGLPNPTMQEILVKASLLTFNDANVTGNYTVLHAKLSKPFRDQFSPEKLQQTFKPFADGHIDFDLIVAKPIVPTSEAQINSDGVLMLRGYFDTTPSRVTYDLDFIRSEGEWKLSKLNVRVKPPGQ